MKMLLLLAAVGVCTGWALGWVFANTCKLIDGKREVDDYMTQKYGADWHNLNQPKN